MRLEPGQVPDHTIDAVRRSLRGRVRSFFARPDERFDRIDRPGRIDDFGEPPPPPPPPDDAAIALPHYVYSLGIHWLRGDVIGHATPTMLRVLIHDGLGWSASAEIPVGAMGQDDPVPDVSAGASAAEMARVIELAESIEGPNDPFEVRLLRAPAMRISAVWLHHADADDRDRFWLLGEIDRRDRPSGGIDREAMNRLLRTRARAWNRAYSRQSGGDDDPAQLGG